MVDRVIDEALEIATENQLLKAMLRRLVGQRDLSPWGYVNSDFAQLGNESGSSIPTYEERERVEKTSVSRTQEDYANPRKDRRSPNIA